MSKVTQLARGRALRDPLLWQRLCPACYLPLSPCQCISRALCSLLTPSPDSGGSWATSGCSVTALYRDSTACFCNHSTNFAILLQVYDVQVRAGEGAREQGQVISLPSFKG